MILLMFSMNTKKKVQNFCDYRTIVFQLLSHGLTLLRPHGLQSTRLLCPWDSPGKNTGVGCHVLLQGIFPTQESNPHLLHCKQILYPLSHLGSPIYVQNNRNIQEFSTQSNIYSWLIFSSAQNLSDHILILTLKTY